MLLVTGPLAKFVFGTGMRVLEMCHEAKQCEVQVARIGVRTQNVLGTLKNAGEHFSDEAQLETSLLELKGVFEILQSLVGRCGLPASYSKRASAAVLRRKNPNKQALTDAEAKLEQITKDLGLPMLTDIKQQLNRMQNESAASASRDTDVLAEVIRSEIQKAMMVSVGSGVTIKDIIDAKVARIEGDTYHECKRAPPAETAVAGGAERGQAASVGAPPSKKVGSMVMMLGRVRYDKLKEKEVLGQGTFGVVLAGTYEGREVAIKRARGCLGSTQIIEAFRQEVEIQYAMRHANIVEVIAFGLGDAERPPCLVMERMHESLYDLLGVQGIDLDPVSKVSIVQDVSEGLRFLHSRGIVHRDLKSLNILLDDAWTAKISDFGLAKVNSSIATATGGGFYSKVGSDFWMAPEVHSNRKATRASDVFSLHVVMWEVLAQERAGHGKPIGERLQTNPTARLPPMDMDCSAAVESNLRNIVDRCGCSVPSERPKMDEVCSVVTAVLDHLESPQENPLEEVAAVPAPQPQLQPHEEERQQQDQQQQDQQQQQQREQRPPEERQEQRGAEASEQHDEHVSTQEQQTHQRQTPQQHHQQQPPPPPPQEEEEGGKQEGEKQEERKVQEEEQKEASTEKQGPQQELQQAQQEQGEQTKRQQEERLEDERRGEQEEEEEKGGEENKQKQEQNEQEAEQDSQENEQEEQEKEQQETEQDAHEFEQERQKKKQQPQPRKASPSFMGRLRRTKKNRAPRDDKRGGATRVEQPKQEEPQDEQDSETQGEQHEDQGEQQEQEQEQPEQQKEEEEKEAGPQETEDPQGEAKHEQSEQQERERSKRNPSFMKRLGRRSKKDRPHGTTGTGTGETAVLSVGSNASSSSSSSTSKPRPEQRPRQSLDGTSRPALVTPTARKVSSMGSPQPTQHDSGDELPPPYVSSESEASSPVTAKRDRRTDRAVLIKLLRQWSPSSATNNSTARSAWTHSTGWGTRIAMGDWHGVCTRYEDDEEGRYERVTAMKLPMNGLSGGLLEGVTTLDCLVDLDLKDNHLTGVLSASIRNLRLLETLDLSGTKLTGTIPRELGDLVALTVLDLHQTSLHGDIPETLGNLVCLETLDLSSCDLSGCIPTEFERLKALRVLRLGHNRLAGEIPAVLATLDRLEEINLGGNQLTGKILAVSGSWPGLRVLDMSDNRLEGCIPPELVEFEHLTTLILYRNFGITGSIPPWIGSMASLEEMDLSAMQLGGEIPQELGQLTRLTRLSLGSCGLVGTIPPELGQLKSLKHLALYDNDLTGTFPREVLKIPTLRNVNFENNNFTVKKAVISGRKSAIKSMLPRGCSLRL